jgi:hypothetical protein
MRREMPEGEGQCSPVESITDTEFMRDALQAGYSVD